MILASLAWQFPKLQCCVRGLVEVGKEHVFILPLFRSSVSRVGIIFSGRGRFCLGFVQWVDVDLMFEDVFYFLDIVGTS